MRWMRPVFIAAVNSETAVLSFQVWSGGAQSLEDNSNLTNIL